MLKNYSRIINEILSKNDILSGEENLIKKVGIKNEDGIILKDVGGLRDVKEKLTEIIYYTFINPNLFSYMGLKPVKGIILEGKPGCGKTLLVKAIANEYDINVIKINGPDFINRYVGQSEENLRDIFNEAYKKKPSIIIFDEIDSFAFSRGLASSSWERTLVNQLLSLMDGLSDQTGVITIATTNSVDAIDDALKRPGRFDYTIKVNPPTYKELIEILEVHTRNMPLSELFDYEKVTKYMNNFTGAQVSYIVKEAAMRTLKKFRKTNSQNNTKNNIERLCITEDDFIQAVKEYKNTQLDRHLDKIFECVDKGNCFN
jgi:transitional endoplasmic reticulum ATPase